MPDKSTAKAWAFESITSIGSKLMVGVEGGETGQTSPLIREFDPSDTTQSPIGSFTGNVWSLNFGSLGANKGMEAMTFVPAAQAPTTWSRTNNNFNGYFLVGLQTTPSVIYVYNLPAGNGGTQIMNTAGSDNYGQITSFSTALLNVKMSDMCFAGGNLWVLYDDVYDALQKLQLTPSIALVTQTMPMTPTGVAAKDGAPTMVNCEGITFNGSTMFLALDQNDSDPNYVLQYNNFSVT